MATRLRADRLLTPTDAHEPGFIVFDDDHIIDLGSGEGTDIDTRVTRDLDLPGCTIMPGLIDGHVHLTGTTPMSTPGFELSTTRATMRGVINCRETLNAGVTTVRDLGSPNEVIFDLRDWVARGRLAGPRIVAAGEGLTSTGGHGDKVPASHEVGSLEAHRAVVSKGHVADGSEALIRAVRVQSKFDADLIKVWTTDGITDESGGRLLHFSPEELATIAAEAHRRDLPIAAHAQSSEAVELCADIGVRSVEHALWAKPAAIERLIESGTYLTLTYATLFALAEDDRYSETVRSNTRKGLDHHVDVLADIDTDALRIAMGSDAGTVIPNGANPVEAVRMVDELGLSPERALEACTTASAAMLELDDRIGRLAPGHEPDMVAIEGDPREKISLLADCDSVRLVVAGGRVVRHAE